jgi:Putative peptidoglycan binding domain
MKKFLSLISCFGLATLAYGQNPEASPAPKKKSPPPPQAAQHAQGHGPQHYTTTPSSHNAGIGRTMMQRNPPTRTTSRQATGLPFGRGKQNAVTGHAATKTTTAAGGMRRAGATAGTRSFTPRHFNLPSKSKPAAAVAPAVTFKQGAHIQGSQHWTGSSYTVFRTYTPVWHDRIWWTNHYNNIVFVFGGWYYWNAGYWYPAWGYAPNAYYAYDGPIYAYNDLPPDQVIANVQASLQEQGYYHGEVDGILGPLTRAAIADYQRDHDLYITSAIDEPTLASLGMV